MAAMLSRCRSMEDLRSSTESLSISLSHSLHIHSDDCRSSDGPSSPSSSSDRSTESEDADFQFSPSQTLESVTSPESTPSGRLFQSPTFSAGKVVVSRGAILDQSSTRQLFQHRSRKHSIAKPPPVYFRPQNSVDRFIPARTPDDSTTVPFRLGKIPQLLSPDEQLVRRRDPRADPFTSSSPVRSPVPLRRNGAEPRTTPHYLPRQLGDIAYELQHSSVVNEGSRRISAGAVWNVGGPSTAAGGPTRGPLAGIPDGHGGLLASGTSAPMYHAKFFAGENTAKNLQRHESRLALALDIDQAARVLNIGYPRSNLDLTSAEFTDAGLSPITWKDCSWTRNTDDSCSKKTRILTQEPVPSTPFRVLDAPLLRDDFYCSTLAYCCTSHLLAVGLGNRVYLWSEKLGVQYPPLSVYQSSNYVTSLSFSSQEGGHSILAVARQGGQVSLWSTFDADVRFEVRHPHAVSYVAFKQVTTHRKSEHVPGSFVEVEQLAVGDDIGNVWLYVVEWTSPIARARLSWDGTMVLLAKISAHTQQICGLVWSPDGGHLATGGNDNACLLFDIGHILGETDLERQHGQRPSPSPTSPSHRGLVSSVTAASRVAQEPQRGRRRELTHRAPLIRSDSPSMIFPGSIDRRSRSVVTESTRPLYIPPNRHKHRFRHFAAVKAIAFAPWQPSLLATGGGSNDRCIRFFHTPSGACLATINVYAQVTSLIWSKTRREIAATFGYAQPEHPFRIAVFAWPSCQQVVAIPWGVNPDGSPDSDSNVECGRALWAIGYPGGPNESSSSESTAEQQATPPPPSTTPEAAPGSPVLRETGSILSFSTDSDVEDIATRARSMARPPVPHKEGGTWWSRTAEEGCIIVASSDECVKFHEVWSGARKSTSSSSGLFGGSAILESIEGIEKEGKEIIR
ncbi:hypothetical protein AJ80_00988 [Polytolypa hystricis UAMH7299]|uniref:Uncharacterized protein n=1 Tax=Polytolypa hystricis (strain UAMH7299) TaxID=1447883 RepID=A0A2B7Z2C3_POLH7|nr:hypothetical protein AJ80_00988 [Polytolypa hystricis UAMH7299]